MTQRRAQRPSPGQQGRKKSHTVRNEFIVFLLVLLGCGGCFAVIGGGLGSTDNAVEQREGAAGHPGGSGDPVTIQPGKRFRIDEMMFHPGWRVRESSLSTNVKGLSVTNARGKRPMRAQIEVKLWSADELLGIVHCSTGALDGGQTGSVTCSGTDRPIISYTKVTANSTS